MSLSSDVCLPDMIHGCYDFFSTYKDEGFEKYKMTDVFTPGSKILACSSQIIEGHLKGLKQEDESGAAYSLQRIVQYGIPVSLKEKIPLRFTPTASQLRFPMKFNLNLFIA